LIFFVIRGSKIAGSGGLGLNPKLWILDLSQVPMASQPVFAIYFKGCLPPCISSSYPMRVKEVHINSITDPFDRFKSVVLENLVQLHFEYITTQTEEEVETYIYDSESFLTALGGNLGLVLGFSCLSVLLNILEKILAKGIIKQQNITI